MILCESTFKSHTGPVQLITTYIEVRRGEHVKFDQYAFFAITGSEAVLDGLIGVLEASNRFWESRTLQNPANLEIRRPWVAVRTLFPTILEKSNPHTAGRTQH